MTKCHVMAKINVDDNKMSFHFNGKRLFHIMLYECTHEKPYQSIDIFFSKTMTNRFVK